MDKALKVLVVLVLFLSIAAVTIEVVLFHQREELKGRNNRLMKGVCDLAATFEVPSTNADLAVKDAPHVKLGPENLKQFYKLGDDGKPSTVSTGPGTMDGVLLDVKSKAETQFNRLNDTRDDLTNTRGVLAATSNLLLKTEGELASTSNKLVSTEQELAVAKQDIEKKAGQITELNGTVETQKAEIEKKVNEIAKLTEKVSDCESKIDAGKRYIQKIEKRLKICEGNFDTNALPRGIQGQIAVVNTNWNFVVMSILPDSEMLPMTDLTVQRGDKLVGKVRVSEIRKDQQVALGEIIIDALQIPLAKGDNVFY